MPKPRKGKEKCIDSLSTIQSHVSRSNTLTDVEEKISQSSPLLSLLPEIRYMIWKAAVAMDPILLLGRAYTSGAPIQALSLASTSLPPSSPPSKCRDLHQYPSSKSKTNRSKKPRAPTPLSWLRTNRQIYTEARSILYEHMTVHFCNVFTFNALFLQPRTSIIHPALLRSLSFCLTLVIDSDLRDGFRLSRAPGIAHGWETGHGRGVCCCPFCFANFASFATGSVDDVMDKLPAVRELRLRIEFRCRWGQGNVRPVVGQFANGRVRKGHLYRPRNPVPLVCVDDRATVVEFVREFCGLWPLKIFEGRKMEVACVDFSTEGIKHDPRNECPHPSDRCWCRGRNIDKESLQMSGIVEEIEKRMLDR
jgi:hypothetical protein